MHHSSQKSIHSNLEGVACQAIVHHSHYLELEKDINIVFASTKGKIPKPSQWKLPMVLEWLHNPTYSILSDEG
jgi:hypothetical protein